MSDYLTHDVHANGHGGFARERRHNAVVSDVEVEVWKAYCLFYIFLFNGVVGDGYILKNFI